MKEVYGRKVSDVAFEDIKELEGRINGFNSGLIDEDKFKAYRLTRGVYGQRQTGVQMLRIKIPYGKLTSEQFIRVADIAEKYTNGRLHLTTRQNIQMHYIKLDDSPEIWAELEDVGITAREACGNTVRNVTGSPQAGVDPNELFDVSPYVQKVFEFFLRNPICQEMGRKVKIAFSSSDQDSAFTYIHDFGFIPRFGEDGRRGFKVVIGGGLGAQSIVAQEAYGFLPEEELLPFLEAAIRVFDRYGERARRQRARLKFLIKEIGLEAFLELVKKERIANRSKSEKLQFVDFNTDLPSNGNPDVEPYDDSEYALWESTNVFEQKQKGTVFRHGATRQVKSIVTSGNKGSGQSGRHDRFQLQAIPRRRHIKPKASVGSTEKLPHSRTIGSESKVHAEQTVCILGYHHQLSSFSRRPRSSNSLSVDRTSALTSCPVTPENLDFMCNSMAASSFSPSQTFQISSAVTFSM